MDITPIPGYSQQQEVRLMALPPWAQEKREKDAILIDPRLEALLNGREVIDIQKMSTEEVRVYAVSLSDGDVFMVTVIYIPRKDHICSPAQFMLVFPESP